MKTILITLSLLASTVAFSEEKPRGVGEAKNQQCECETCFVKYGICTSVNQSNQRKDTSRSNAGSRSRGSKSIGQ